MRLEFDKQHEKHIREFDRTVETLFDVEMLAAGFEKRGQAWKPLSDEMAASSKTKRADQDVDGGLQTEISNALSRYARKQLDADPKVWLANIKFARTMQRDLVRAITCIPEAQRSLLSRSSHMRKEYGAASRLEKLLVEWMILARLYRERLTNLAPQNDNCFMLPPLPKPLITQFKSADHRVKKAARLWATARRLLGKPATGDTSNRT